MLRDLLTPEAQAEPHHWSATFGAHCWIALGPWGLIAIGWDRWLAAWLTPLLYLICWEGMQLALAKRRTAALVWDSVLDTVAVAFACYAAACTASGMHLPAVWCWGASVGVMYAGWKVRE